MTSKIVVALFERAEGNESIGTEWTETGLFDADAPLDDVLTWAEKLHPTHDGKPRGRLMLRYADDQRREA